MLAVPQRAFVANQPVDMRRSIDGLALLVEALLDRSPLSGEMFVFFNKTRDKVKLLWFDRHGFWMAYKRLERGRFKLPVPAHEISWADLLLILEGVDPKTRRFKAITAERVA